MTFNVDEPKKPVTIEEALARSHELETLWFKLVTKKLAEAAPGEQRAELSTLYHVVRALLLVNDAGPSLRSWDERAREIEQHWRRGGEDIPQFVFPDRDSPETLS